jgi:hypothetical protein
MERQKFRPILETGIENPRAAVDKTDAFRVKRAGWMTRVKGITV